MPVSQNEQFCHYAQLLLLLLCKIVKALLETHLKLANVAKSFFYTKAHFVVYRYVRLFLDYFLKKNEGAFLPNI